MSGLRDGFRVGFNYEGHTCRSSKSNLPLAREHTQVISDYLAAECAEGRVVGPHIPCRLVGLGVIPKGSTCSGNGGSYLTYHHRMEPV